MAKVKKKSSHKPHHYTQMSGVKCQHPGCKKFLKLNLVLRKATTPRYCYRHYVQRYRVKQNQKTNDFRHAH